MYEAIWLSEALNDLENHFDYLNNGFFIQNDCKKYSVGENEDMKLNEDGVGIEIYVAAEQSEGVPEENWLPINRKDEDLSINLRIYVPDLEKMETWSAPTAEIVT